jgi:hypothetical protein
MLSLGAAALGAVALVPVAASAGHGYVGHVHGHGGATCKRQPWPLARRSWPLAWRARLGLGAAGAGVGARASMSVPPTADAGRQVMAGCLAAGSTS